jgi:ketosteroid isomerase-like protein
MEDRETVARTYYRAIDDDEYDRLRSLLAADFEHVRPDRTLSGPDRFVRFMREERPQRDTDHVLRGVYADGASVAVEGHLLSASGDRMFGFVDVFAFEGERIETIRTYTA